MAHTKAGGTARNLTDSGPKYLGVKLYQGESAQPGSVIIRQRGTVYLSGKNTRLGKDHTIYSVAKGKVDFKNKRHLNFNGKTRVKKIVSVK